MFFFNPILPFDKYLPIELLGECCLREVKLCCLEGIRTDILEPRRSPPCSDLFSLSKDTFINLGIFARTTAMKQRNCEQNGRIYEIFRKEIICATFQILIYNLIDKYRREIAAVFITKKTSNN
ncbi:CLUMA_CG021067, isoform A [Clunio marinus]|uniref:CLUMA_CG021067, isoform A n=1 Tax=Clunio marinus TaxID=568069 RepID=A0A1J1J829_9DIPT|nr:CLUMA_CG021067, isoform A [Clunio marinus]